MAAATRNIGFGVTIATTYEQPYHLARRLSTVDHLSGGRVGWNIVTGYLDSAARNLGLTEQPPHDERYAIADEYVDAVYKLWCVLLDNFLERYFSNKPYKSTGSPHGEMMP